MSYSLNKRQETTMIKSNLMYWSQFVERTGVSPERLAELVEMGWVQTVQTSSENYHFPEKETLRVQKLERICRDFELPTIGGTIIVDLLERIELMEKEIDQLRRLVY